MAGKKYGGKDFLSDILRGAATGLGAPMVPGFQAQAAGIPEGAGTSPEIFQAMMRGREDTGKMDLLKTKYDLMTDLQADRFKKQAELEAARAEAKKKFFSYTETLKGGTDPRTRFKYNFMLRMGMNPAFQFDAIDLEGLSSNLDTLYTELGGLGKPKPGAKTPGAKKDYKSPDELQKAYDNREIDAAELKRVAKVKGWE